MRVVPNVAKSAIVQKWLSQNLRQLIMRNKGGKQNMIPTLYEPFRHWSEKGSVYILFDLHFDDADCKFMSPDPTPVAIEIASNGHNSTHT